MTYIHHVTLNTGHSLRSPRSDVEDETMAVLVTYLDQVVKRGGRHPTPIRALAHYSCMATVEDGGLLVTIYAPSGPHIKGEHALGGSGHPIITLGVAQRSRQGRDLWGRMVAQFGAAAGLEKPSEPWCAVALRPALNAYFLEAWHWLAEFETCIAWAWITRHAALRAINDPR